MEKFIYFGIGCISLYFVILFFFIVLFTSERRFLASNLLIGFFTPWKWGKMKMEDVEQSLHESKNHFEKRRYERLRDGRF